MSAGICSRYFQELLTNQKIANALKMYRYRSIIPIGTSGTLKFNIAVFSKYPISKSRKIKYDSSFNGSSIHELDIRGKKLTLINNHLESFKLTMEDRSHYSAFIKNLNSETLDGLRSSIEQKLGPAFRIRARQARAVAEEIKRSIPIMYWCAVTSTIRRFPMPIVRSRGH